MHNEKTIEEILDLKKLGDNKIIIYVDNEYKLVFKTIIDKVLRNYGAVPITWEDIYYEFLYSAPKWVKEYDTDANIRIKTYLGIKCKFFAMNKCSSFSGNKYKILNTYVSMEKSGLEARLEDSKHTEIPIDISKLSDPEVAIYNDYYLDGKSILSIERNRNISRYKIRQLVNSVKSKLLIQIKN